MQQYLDLLRKIRQDGIVKSDRTAVSYTHLIKRNEVYTPIYS